MRSASRDDFKQRVKEEIAKRAGGKCSNPDCRKLTVGPTSSSTGTLSIGGARHIKAAAPGGPRYDPSQSTDERASPENAIWLCADCARIVDSDPTQYPAEKLQAWKKQHEAWVRGGIGRTDREPITEVAGEHVARGRGNVTALDIGGPAIIKPGTKSVAWPRVGPPAPRSENARYVDYARPGPI